MIYIMTILYGWESVQAYKIDNEGEKKDTSELDSGAMDETNTTAMIKQAGLPYKILLRR